MFNPFKYTLISNEKLARLEIAAENEKQALADLARTAIERDDFKRRLVERNAEARALDDSIDTILVRLGGAEVERDALKAQLADATAKAAHPMKDRPRDAKGHFVKATKPAPLPTGGSAISKPFKGHVIGSAG
jgi:hypothetical protein